MINDIRSLSTLELFSLFVTVLEELRRREVTRSANNPVADYAEFLCEKALALRRAPKSTKGYDGIDGAGRKYEVKARRITTRNRSRQLSALRNLNEGHFDFLVGVLFAEDFSLLRACLVPHAQVLNHSAFRKHTNAWIFHLRDSVWSLPGVVDITSQLLEVAGGADIGS